MKNIRISIASIILATAFFLPSCSKQENKPDASGTFEANEAIISAEGSGRLLRFTVEEGDTLAEGQVIGNIDSLQLLLRKKQLQAQIAAILSKQPDAASQLATIQEQLAVARHEQERFTQLQKNGASTQKQVDDISGQVRVLEKQFDALKQSLSITTGGIKAETLPLLAQIDQLNDQLHKCTVVNPVRGTILTKYAEQNEVTAPGKALYKIADLHTLTLRAYIAGTQLPNIKIGQQVKVMVDDGAQKYREMQGTITWIASKAEFTPKTIQTKEERANLVYALKIAVKNDGSLKIGMYGEVHL